MSDIAPADPWTTLGDGMAEAMNGIGKAFAALGDACASVLQPVIDFLAAYDPNAPKPGTWAYEVAEAVDVVLEVAEERFDQAILDLTVPDSAEHGKSPTHFSVYVDDRWVKLA